MVPIRYDGIDNFSEGLASFRVGNLFGFVNKKGEEVIPPQFTRAYGFNDGVAMVEYDDSWCILKKPVS